MRSAVYSPHTMTIDNNFLECVREADWASALLLVERGQLESSLVVADSPVFARLIELDAPANLIVSLLKHFVRTQSVDQDRLGLLEICLCQSSTKAHAFETFSSLLAHGLSPNIIVAGKGCTLLQEAMELNKVREANELISHGVDPQQMSVYGGESTSNLEEAMRLGNAAAKVVLMHFRANS